MPNTVKTTKPDNEQWARAKLYSIDAYTLGPDDRAWYHSKANDIWAPIHLTHHDLELFRKI